MSRIEEKAKRLAELERARTDFERSQRGTLTAQAHNEYNATALAYITGEAKMRALEFIADGMNEAVERARADMMGELVSASKEPKP